MTNPSGTRCGGPRPRSVYLEDVYYLYEKDCRSCTDEGVHPISIGDNSIPCKLSRKCYIRPGEECPICLEKMITKQNSYLTGCGHAFHRSCLFKTFETRWSFKPFSTFRCPLCRCGLGAPLLMTRYVNSIHMNKKYEFTDQLENFWITQDFTMPYYCDKKTVPHYLGMCIECSSCREYQTKG